MEDRKVTLTFNMDYEASVAVCNFLLLQDVPPVIERILNGVLYGYMLDGACGGGND